MSNKSFLIEDVIYFQSDTKISVSQGDATKIKSEQFSELSSWTNPLMHFQMRQKEGKTQMFHLTYTFNLKSALKRSKKAFDMYFEAPCLFLATLVTIYHESDKDLRLRGSWYTHFCTVKVT